jgi:hypothetical protein
MLRGRPKRHGCLFYTRIDGRQLGFCAAIIGIVFRARLALKVDRHRLCHCPHQRNLQSHLSPSRVTA